MSDNEAKALREIIQELRTQNTELRMALAAFLECPVTVDQATVPKAGVEACPEQVVVNFSCSLIKLRNAAKAIENSQ